MNLNFEIVQKIEDKNKELLELIDIINRQDAEIESLKKDLSVSRDAYISIQDRYEHAKSEARKEFIEKIKEKKMQSTMDIHICTIEMIDNLLKEMESENNA